MLLVLNDSLHTCIGDPVSEGRLSNALETIANAYREGKHVVLASSKTLDVLLARLDINSKARAIFTKIKNEMPLYGAFQREVSRYVLVSSSPRKTIIKSGNQNILQLPFYLFEDSSAVQKTVLLAENLIDSYYYVKFAQLFASRRGLRGFRTNAQCRGGGGSQVPAEYRTIQDSESGFCLCIVDSDQEAPLDSYGDVAAQVLAVENTSLPMTEAIIISFRKIENCLPSSILLEVCNKNKTRTSALDILRYIERQGQVEMRNFLDFKKGLLLKDIYTLPRDDPVRTFWSEKLQILANEAIIANCPCLSNGECDQNESCQCQAIPGFGEKVLNEAFDIISKMTIHKISESLCNITESEWHSVGHHVFSWCCSRDKINV